jgi:thiosulfate/3-mercaptopyruvate sulfurtransferase
MGSPLVSADWLHERLADEGSQLVVLDVRWELGPGARPDLFEAGHIPGARFIDLDQELAAPPGPGGRHPLPDAGAFQGAMRRAGVSSRATVVIYDAGPATAAARAWWLLRYFGHEAVAVLDGGWSAWVEEGHPQETGPQWSGRSGDFTAHPGGMPVIDATGAVRLASHGVLLDARAPQRYAGQLEPVDPVAGHIPGARSRPTTENLTAAHQVLALELAGVTAALYPGSWSEWITDPGRPVATGREP